MRNRFLLRVGASLAGGLALLAFPASAAERPALSAFEPEIRPLLQRYCVDCHSTAKHKGDVDLERFASLAQAREAAVVWQGVSEQVASGEMPPKDKPQPTPAERERLIGWVDVLLDDLAQARAGDPGPVVLRRLSNAEYTYTLRDLTGVPGLDPAREFPVDGAAGEGFMNAGAALVMSPSLFTKYLDAARSVVGHAVLLPDGIKFSAGTTRRDWTDEILGEIRGLYRRYTDAGGGTRVNLQGIVFETNEGGGLPWERYLGFTLQHRQALGTEAGFLESQARREGLSPRYARTLWHTLTNAEPSLILDQLRSRWKMAGPAEAHALATDLVSWQKVLWRFNSVGHIGKVGGPRSWQEGVDPLAARRELRRRLAAPTNGAEVTAVLTVADAGDGAGQDVVVWERPRLVGPGRPELLLRDLPAVNRRLAAWRAQLPSSVAPALAAAAEVQGVSQPADVEALARKHGVEAGLLAAWFQTLGLGTGGPVTLKDHLTQRLTKVGGYEFVNGVGSSDTPLVLVSSGDQAVRIPGNLRARGLVMHPSPTLRVAAAWQSPVAGRLRVEGRVGHAHPECGNGVAWTVEVRRGATRQRLAGGHAQGGKPVEFGPWTNVPVALGDVVVVSVGPRDGNHACDLTAVDLTLSDGTTGWDLAKEVSADGLAANPHADAQGHPAVWHFFTEPDRPGDGTPVLPAGSLLARWQAAADPAERTSLATELAALLRPEEPAGLPPADAALRRLLRSATGPLLLPAWRVPAEAPAGGMGWGTDPAGGAIEGASLARRGPARVEFQIPAELAEGADLVTEASLHPQLGREGCVQVELGAGAAAQDGPLGPASPFLVQDGSAARARLEKACDAFRGVFPAAVCYPKIVPVDEVVTLTLMHREDEPLQRLLLEPGEKAELDRLWSQLHFVAQDALTLVDAFEQLWQFATQDGDPKLFEPLRVPIQQRAEAFRRELVEAEPRHVDAVVAWAARAWRRPLTVAEESALRDLYARLRREDLGHEPAVRTVLARVLTAPAFLYRAEQAGPGRDPAPVSDWELASRLSYFLTSSAPDATLTRLAAEGRLRDPGELVRQGRRLLGGPGVRRLAVEFGCQWLHVHGFDELDEKSERHFPSFRDLRGAMYEETIRFFEDFFASNRPVTDLLDSDDTFLNEALAKHYGIPGVTGPEWRRVAGLRQHGRGGLLGLATTLAKQSGASRTSPILRGNWVAEVLLGDKLPRPPADVPRLPEDEASTEGRTVRELVERHSEDPRCAGCHRRIDPYGFALESFDAIGRRRERDLGDRPIDTRVRSLDGAEFTGLDGLRGYLLNRRRDAFLRQFSRKLLGYALGRSVMLSDRPLLDEMKRELLANELRVGAAIDTILRSRQFREIRGREAED